MSTSHLSVEALPIDQVDDWLPPHRLQNSAMDTANVLLWIGCSGLAFAAVAVPFGTLGTVLGLVGLIVGGTLSVCALIARSFAAQLQSDLDALEAGEIAAIHWTYTANEWMSHVDNERSEAQGHVLVGSVLFGFFSLFAAQGIASASETPGSAVTTFMLTLAAGTSLGAIVGWFIELGMHWNCNRMQRRIGETLIAESGLYFDGTYRRWEALGSRLVSVELLSDQMPLTIDFCFYLHARRHSSYQHVRVPVPAGQENVAVEYVTSVKCM